MYAPPRLDPIVSLPLPRPSLAAFEAAPFPPEPAPDPRVRSGAPLRDGGEPESELQHDRRPGFSPGQGA